MSEQREEFDRLRGNRSCRWDDIGWDGINDNEDDRQRIGEIFPRIPLVLIIAVPRPRSRSRYCLSSFLGCLTRTGKLSIFGCGADRPIETIGSKTQLFKAKSWGSEA